MKKFTLLLCVFVVSVMMPQWVLAEGEPTTETLSTSPLSITKSSDGVLTISSVNAGDLKTFMLNPNNLEQISSAIVKMKTSTSIVLIGYFNSEDLSSISNGAGFDAVESVDMNEVIFPTDKSDYKMTVVNSIPDRGNSERVYITGSTIYVGQQITTIDENLSQETIESVSSWQEWAWDYQKQTLEAGWYKLFVSAYYERKKGRYVVVTPDQSDVENYVAADAVPATNNGNDLIYVLENETTTYYHWDNNEEYWAPISSLPANVDQTVYTDNVEGINNPEVGKIYRIKSGSYLYCHILKPFVWAQGVKDVNDQSLSFYYKNIKDAPAPQSAQDFAVVGGVFHYYYLNEWTTEESNWLLTDFSYWSSSLKTAILPASVTVRLLNDKSNIVANCNQLTMLVLGNTYATITRGENNNNSAEIHNASSEAEKDKLKAILKDKTGLSLNDDNISSPAIAENPGFNNGKYVFDGDLNTEGNITTLNNQTGLIVLDLKGASNVSKENLAKLTNQDIEYIVLPGNMTKDFVCDTTTYYKAKDELRLNKLKAVISAESTNLVAHVVVPGHLAQARCYATGNKQNREGRPAVKELTSVTLSGNLNANDISTHDEDKGLSGENYTITTMDLEKAYFANYNDMQFQAAGFQGQSNECVLKNIKLPTTPRMTDIPKDCFRNMKSLDSLCIPFNYKHIHNGALYDSNVEHLTTTDSIGGAVIDNGKYTYTLSANIEELGDAPSPKLNGEGKPNGTEIYVFPKENGVTEIYSLATKVPKCYKDVFSFDVTFGYGGQDESKVYCRDRFFNNGEREKSFVVLRYPSEEVFNRREKKGKPVEANYTLMEQKYTDITKDYTKKDQTGAVDANGNSLLWPSRTEMNRSYNQASVGALWNDWSKSYTGSNNSEINFDEDPVNNVNNGNGNGGSSRRFDSGNPVTQNIDLTQGMTQYVERTESGGTYTFTPTADVQNMFQYMPYDVDNNTYKKIVIEFAEPVPEGFFIHHYGERGTYYSLKGLTEYEFVLTGPTIDDFTIFNWDSYWGEGFEYEAQQDRRNIKISRAYLTSDNYSQSTASTSKYGHESDITEDFIDYMGWHQIVLTQAVYYEPVEKEVEEDVVTRRYEDAGWFTFCIPYDMTYSQVVKMMGVPASTDKVKNYIGDSEDPEAVDIMPDIRQLRGVERVAGNGTANKVTFRLTRKD